MEEFISRTCGLASALTNRPFPVLEIRVTYPQPEDVEAYTQRFDCPIYFNQPRTQILWDVKARSYNISLANEEVCKLCEQQCKLLIDQMMDADLLSSKIRSLLLRIRRFPHRGGDVQAPEHGVKNTASAPGSGESYLPPDS